MLINTMKYIKKIQENIKPYLEAVNEIKEKVEKELRSVPLEQFIDGYYCEKCGIGFIPQEKIKQ